MIIDNVPMEDVEFVVGHSVEDLEEVEDTDEVAGRVDEEAAPCEAGFVVD